MKIKKTVFFSKKIFSLRKIFWIFVFGAVLFLGNFSFSSAAEPDLGVCMVNETGGEVTEGSTGPIFDKTKAECDKLRGNWYKNGTETAEDMKGLAKEAGESCSWIFHPLDCSLLAIIRFETSILSMAATLFAWIVDPRVFLAIVDGESTYTIWSLVRDSLNVAFILMLLFSAFATVFQVDKYSYKNVLVRLIIMALLVNFSFPIARVIIDFSNILMYYFLSLLGPNASNSMVILSEQGPLATLITQSEAVVGGTNGTAFLIGVVVFLFIFVITLLVISVLLVIRAIALAILVMFSSVAFVGTLIPALSSKAGEWWTKLFNYAFFGPIMIFMLYVATIMMTSIGNSVGKLEMVRVAGNFSNFSKLIAAMAYFSLPIVILWIGIGTAQSMSVAGAGAVVGKAKKWGGKVAAWGTYKPARGIAKATGIPGGVKKRWDKSWVGAEARKKRQGKYEDFIYGKVLRGKTDAREEMNKNMKEYKDKNYSDEKLKSLAVKGDAAAAKLLAENDKMDATTYEAFMEKNKDAGIEKEINSKVKKTRVDLVALRESKLKHQEIMQKQLTQEEIDKFKENNPDQAHLSGIDLQIAMADLAAQEVMDEKIKSLDADAWKKQDWNEINKNLSEKGREEEKRRMGEAIVADYKVRNEKFKEKIGTDMSPGNVRALNDLSGGVIG